VATLVADVPINLVWRCGVHGPHDLVRGDRYNRVAIAAGEAFELPDGECTDRFLVAFGPKPESGAQSAHSATHGIIPGLRRVE
jgi:hypothetical protein